MIYTFQEEIFMKSKISLLLALVMVLVMALSACGTPANNSANNTSGLYARIYLYIFFAITNIPLLMSKLYNCTKILLIMLLI